MMGRKYKKFDLIPLDYDINGDRYINCLDIINSKSSYYVSRLVFPVNHDPNLKRDGSSNLIADFDMDNDGTPDSSDTDDDNDGMTDSYEISYGVANKHADGSGKVYRGWQNPYIYNARYAVLVGGGPPRASKYGGITDVPCATFKNDVIEMHKVLHNDYGWSHENVYCYLWDKDSSYSEWVDGNAGQGNVEGAIQVIGGKITKNDFFYFFEVSHGGDTSGGFFNMYSVYNKKEWGCYFSVLSAVINNAIGDTYACSLFVFASCNAGYAFDYISGKGRIVITSCGSSQLQTFWKEYMNLDPDWCDHCEFLYNDKGNGLIRALHNGIISIKSAFYSGKDAAGDKDKLSGGDTTTPFLDSDGDGSPNNSGDWHLVEEIYL